MSPTFHLAPIDLLIVVSFLAAILGIGFSARLRDSSLLQFLVAGRRLTLPMFVATLVSTWYGGILGIGESVTYFGWGTWLLFGVPFYVFAGVYAVVFARNVRSAEQISLPERLASKWGKSVGLVTAGLVFLLAVPAAHVLMLGVLLRALTGWPLPSAVLVATAVGTLFLYKGGMLADVRVGIIAFAMMYVGFVAMDGYCLVHHPLEEALRSIDNKTLLRADGGAGPLVFLSFFALGAWTLVDPAFHQRVASAETPEIGKRGVLVSIACWFVFDALSITAGMYALALVRPLPSEPLQIFPMLGEIALPAGLKGIFFCGMAGTILSAMVGYTLVSGSTIGRELVARIRGATSESDIKRWTRLGFAIASAVAVALALYIDSVVNLWYQWGGCVVGALLVPVCMAYHGPRRTQIGSRTVFASMAGAFLVSFAWLICGKRAGNEMLEITAFGQRFGLGTLVPALAVSAATLAVGAAVTHRRMDDGGR